jgi:hypothetical protein
MPTGGLLSHLASPKKQKDGWHGLLAARVPAWYLVREHGLQASRATRCFFGNANIIRTGANVYSDPAEAVPKTDAESGAKSSLGWYVIDVPR